MPKSKRNKQVELAKTKKRGLEWKKKLFQEIRNAADSYSNVFIFSVADMRNAKLKNVREQWKDSRFFIGKNKIMAMALGRSTEEEYKPNLHKIGQRIKGQRGLLFSNRSYEDVLSWFRSYSEGDFARSGNIATVDVKLLEGPLPDFPHNLEPYLRQLGLPTSLVKGVIHLVKDHQVCKEGDVLTPETAKILKMLGYQMAEFHITINSMWSKDGTFVQFTSDDELDTKENKNTTAVSSKVGSRVPSSVETEKMEVEDNLSDSSEAPELVDSELVEPEKIVSPAVKGVDSTIDASTPKDKADGITHDIERSEETPKLRGKKRKQPTKKVMTPKTPENANSSMESPVFRELRSRSVKVNRKKK